MFRIYGRQRFQHLSLPFIISSVLTFGSDLIKMIDRDYSFNVPLNLQSMLVKQKKTHTPKIVSFMAIFFNTHPHFDIHFKDFEI